MAKNTGKDTKPNAQRKGGKPSRNWKKMVLPLFLVLIMIGAVFAVFGSNLVGEDDTRDIAVTKSLTSIADGIALVPDQSLYVRYADVASDKNISKYMYANKSAYMPNGSYFGAIPRKDLISVYPDGHFGNFTEQWVYLTDFGPGNLYSYANGTMLENLTFYRVLQDYYYSPETDPVVIGKIQPVYSTLRTMKGLEPNAASEYEDLFRQLIGYPFNEKTAKLSVAGNFSRFDIADKFYAGITPDNGAYHYQVVMHLQTPWNDTVKAEKKTEWEKSALYNYKFDYYQVEFEGDYIIIDASGSFDVCINDMTGVWNFMPL